MSISEYEKGWCTRILNDMFKWHLTAPFRVPVDPVRDGAEGYYEKIKNPIDLSAIKKKLNDNKYITSEQFIDDVRLIHRNAQEFNGDNSMITYIASDIIKWLEEQVKTKAASYDEEWRNKMKCLTEKLNNHMDLNPATWRLSGTKEGERLQ